MADGMVEYVLRLRDEASAQLTGVASEAKSTEAALKRVDSAGSATGGSMRRLRDDAGDTGSAMGKLGGALSSVDPALADLAMTANDAADGLEGVLQLAKVSPVGLAAAGAAAVALGGAYLELKSDLEEAEAAQSKMNQTATRAQQVFLPLSAQFRSIDADYQVLTGSLSEADRAFNEQSETLRGRLIGALSDAGRQALELEDRVRSLGEQQASGADVADELIQASAALAQARGGLTAVERGLIQRYEDALPKLRAVVDAQKQVAESTTTAADAARDQADALEQVAQTLSKGDLLAFLGASGVTVGQTGIDPAAALGFNRIAGEIQQVTTGQRLSAAAGQGLGTLGSIGGLLTNPSALMAAAGPAGPALQFLATLGSQGADAIIDQLKKVAEDIVGGLSEIPSLLLQSLTDLPFAIGQAVGAALRDLLRPDGNGIGEAIKENPGRAALAVLTGGLSELNAGLLKGLGINVPGYAVGDARFVNRTGLAMLHEGERVVRSNGQSAGAVTNMSSSRTINVSGWVSPRVVEDLSREVTRTYDPYGFGRARNPAFGG